MLYGSSKVEDCRQSTYERGYHYQAYTLSSLHCDVFVKLLLFHSVSPNEGRLSLHKVRITSSNLPTPQTRERQIGLLTTKRSAIVPVQTALAGSTLQHGSVRRLAGL